MIRLTKTISPVPTPARLDGPTVFLRPPANDDWVDWADLRALSRDYLTPWEPTWPADALTEGAYQRRVRRLAGEWKSDEGYNFHVFDRHGHLAGGIGLTQIRRGVAQTGTLGYWIGEPFQGRGYTTEAVRLISRFAFSGLQLHRVEAACLPENIASRRVLEKAGFVREGYARLYLKIDGNWRDHLTFALLREDMDALPRLP